MKRLFMLLIFMLFGIGLVGCDKEIKKLDGNNNDDLNDDTEKQYQSIDPLINENDNVNNNEDDQKTGPIVNMHFQFDNFLEFSEFVEKNNSKGILYLTFNFDDNEKIGNKSYLYEIIGNSGAPYDLFNENYSLSYTFESYNYPIGSGIKNQSFKISCQYVINCPQFEENSSIEIRYLDGDDYTKNYVLIVNDNIVLNLILAFPNKVSQPILDEICNMLIENIVFIK